MHLIENYFRISPDGDDGSLEIMFVVLLVMIVIAIWFHLPEKTKDDVRKQRRRW